MKEFLLTILTLCILVGCKTTQTSMLIADSYDDSKDETTLILIPYGNIVIPGEWTKYNYNQTSKQHFFRFGDSTAIAVTKNPIDKYPFYSTELSSSELTNKWYRWEADFYTQKGIEILQLNRESKNEFIIWQAKSIQVNNTFLYGIKNNLAYNFSVVSGNWSNERRVEFLTKLWDNN